MTFENSSLHQISTYVYLTKSACSKPTCKTIQTQNTIYIQCEIAMFLTLVHHFIESARLQPFKVISTQVSQHNQDFECSQHQSKVGIPVTKYIYIYKYIQNQKTNKEINHIMSEYIKYPTTQSINQSLNQSNNQWPVRLSQGIKNKLTTNTCPNTPKVRNSPNT